ncbi:hypothetical protein Tco_1509304 [Tanacetum coccineum]
MGAHRQEYCVLDVQKSQTNLIFSIVVALLKNTNFFRAFMASSTILAIYIQQFWDTIDALDITPTNDGNPFVALPSSDTIIKYVNTLGYPSTLKNVSAMSVNALYQPWRAILSMINMCLTGKTAGYDRPKHPVLQILWGIIHRSNIDYVERIWDEFVQSIQTFLTDRKNLTTASRGKKKTAHLRIPSVKFTKLIIHHLKTKHNIHPRTGSALHYSHEENVLNTLRFVRKDGRKIFGMPIPDALLTDTIKRAPYYNGYLEHVAEYQCYLDEEHDKVDDKTPKPTSSQPPKPIPTPTEPSKKDQGKKRKLVKETSDAPSPAKRSKAGKVTKKRMPKSPLKLVDEPSNEGVPGPTRPVVIREPDSGRIQPLSDVQGKGKEKVIDEQDAHDLLTLQTPKRKSLADQFIFQRRTPMPTEASRHAESPSLDAELALTDSETKSDEEAPKIIAGNQDEGHTGPNPYEQDKGQAGPNPGEQDEGQARSSTGDAAESQPQSSHVDNLKLPTKDQAIIEEPKPHEEEPEKNNAELKVQSMVIVSIHQDTSTVPPMTTPVIDLSLPHSVSIFVHAPLPTSTATTIAITITTSLPPPPPQPQQSTSDPILLQ